MATAPFYRIPMGTPTSILSPAIYSSQFTSPSVLLPSSITRPSFFNWILISCDLFSSVHCFSSRPLFRRLRSSFYSSGSNCSMDCAFRTISSTHITHKVIKKSRFIAIAGHVIDEHAAKSFFDEVRDPEANHNCWAYKVGSVYHSSDDREPPCTAGKPILAAINYSGIDRVMIVVIRHFGGVKLGANGLVRAYGGIASDCLKTATTHIFKMKIPVVVEVPFTYSAVLDHQLHYYKVEDIVKNYDKSEEQKAVISFKVDFDLADDLEKAIKSYCRRDVIFCRRP